MVNLKEESMECVCVRYMYNRISLTNYFEHVLLYPMHKYAGIK